MDSSVKFLILSLFISHLLSFCASDEAVKHYIVYMGGPSCGEEDIQLAELARLQFLSSAITTSREKTERIAVRHVYHHAFRGFSAMLTEQQASLLSGHEEVVSVFPDGMYELHTTRSWDFLGEDVPFQPFQHHHQHPSNSSDVIIGIIDSGIHPESPSFSDKGMGEIPHRWKGICMSGSDPNKSFCNKKIIGARYYDAQSSNSSATGSPRDRTGHGTHTASTAAGSMVPHASYYGLAKGTARGGSVAARIAAYKACSELGCSFCNLLKAIDDAVKDGVDIISLSVGMGSSQVDFLVDPIAIGAFHAQQKGVMVVCSAGNDGPVPYTVGNTAPWLLTVAASNIDRDLVSTVVLGNGISFTGSSINFSNLTKSTKYPLAFAGDLAAASSPASDARNCIPGSLDAKRVAGKIIVCIDKNQNVTRVNKITTVDNAGGKGLIYVSERSKDTLFESGTFPFVQLGEDAGRQILNYIHSSKKPTATILATVTVPRSRPAPRVADFSSRGPGSITENILKPDIMAPGVAILAAMVPPNGTGPGGRKPSNFGVKSGTSMSCPHVSGAAAIIKSVHPDWTPPMIKSALMTTAVHSNNMGQALTNTTGDFATPHESGVGEISPIKALDPGLVFATTTEDYRYFLCYFGYSTKTIASMMSKAMSICTNISSYTLPTVSKKFKCPKGSSETLISNINYPTISIGEMKSHQKRTVKRKVMNVGSPNSEYTVTVQAPQGLKVNVSPKTIVFREGVTKATFTVTFSQAHGKGYKFGSLTWSDGQHNVRLVFAVNIV